MTYEELQKRADEIAEALRGTCRSIHEIVEDGEDDDVELMKALDDRVFCCEECGWWEETSCMAADGTTCLDCNPEDDE